MVVNKFQKGKESGDGSFIIPASLSEIERPFTSLKYPTMNWMKLNQNTFSSFQFLVLFLIAHDN